MRELLYVSCVKLFCSITDYSIHEWPPKSLTPKSPLRQLPLKRFEHDYHYKVSVIEDHGRHTPYHFYLFSKMTFGRTHRKSRSASFVLPVPVQDISAYSA